MQLSEPGRRMFVASVWCLIKQCRRGISTTQRPPQQTPWLVFETTKRGFGVTLSLLQTHCMPLCPLGRSQRYVSLDVRSESCL
jgi:hypothetical protein